ncbi:hypothetical protein HHX47_DHR7000531 [Lentinula edodes]|nr:hypothetical protein HHX47_DHR7000531 [Lentinula edodes]
MSRERVKDSPRALITNRKYDVKTATVPRMLFSFLPNYWVFYFIFSSTYIQWITRLFVVKKSTKEVVENRKGLLPLTASNLILRELSPLDRHRYSLANKEAYDAVSSFNRQAYRIEHILCPYFNEGEIKMFRLIQLKTNTIISGSAALQFFDLTVFDDSDLDLYVVNDWDKVALLTGFLTSIAYDYTPRSDQARTFQHAFQAGRRHHHVEPDLDNDYSDEDIWDVYSFIRASNGKKIQIITCKDNITQVIMKFHSTCVMSVITYTHAYALYPYATFVEKCSIAIRTGRLHDERASVLRAFSKYSKRGWHIESTPSVKNVLRSRSEFRDTARFVGDSACWVIPLAPVEHAYSIDDYNNIPSKVDPIRADSWYTILTDDGQTRIGLRVTVMYPPDSQVAYWFTLASIPRALRDRLGSTANYLGENKSTFSFKNSIEDLVELTRKTFEVEPDVIHGHVQNIVSKACDTMPLFKDWEGKQLGPSVYSIVMLSRQLEIIFNSFREDPSVSFHPCASLAESTHA